MNNDRSVFIQVHGAIETPTSIDEIIATTTLKYFRSAALGKFVATQSVSAKYEPRILLPR